LTRIRAAQRKQSAPTRVIEVASEAFSISFVSGMTKAAIAEIPKATEPIRLSVADRRTSRTACRTASSASTLETRKQTEPTASGDQTNRLERWAEKWW
jgi:hypothetical protein